MKNPNRYGTVSKLSGNRRRPFVVREGKTGNQKIIGYAATREEGFIMLANYNSNPWNIETGKITLQELYELWLQKRAVKLGISNQNSLKSAYQHCTNLKQRSYNQIKAYEMQDCIDSCKLSYSTQGHIKSLFTHLDKFAMELDIISKCYSSLLTTAPTPESNKQIFTDKEVNRLWQNQNMENVDSVLFLLYTGFRISEMADLKTCDIDFELQIMKGGTKTASGKNRIVPIHSRG